MMQVNFGISINKDWRYVDVHMFRQNSYLNRLMTKPTKCLKKTELGFQVLCSHIMFAFFLIFAMHIIMKIIILPVYRSVVTFIFILNDFSLPSLTT